MKQKRISSYILWVAVFLLIAPQLSIACSTSSEYGFWKEIGDKAADKAQHMMRTQHVRLGSGDAVALTNAGYAEIDGRDTNGALDGVSQELKVGRGDHSLVEVHSAPQTNLWFAVYDKASGYCAYLEVDPCVVAGVTDAHQLKSEDLFAVKTIEKINAEHLFANAEEYAEKFSNKIFGGNEFRIVTISNAIANDAPSALVRSFEFHDHYCPGVTSGVILALYLKQFYPTNGGSYFVHTVQPWCKEDALLVMLNATPGKKGYAVSYSTEEDRSLWLPEVQNAANIIYRKSAETGNWEGIVIGFTWGDTGCPTYNNSVMDKLCSDLYYQNNLDHPENFIEVLHEFELPEGVDPKEYARPGVDPMEMLGLVE